jgi:hypothetical protein
MIFHCWDDEEFTDGWVISEYSTGVAFGQKRTIGHQNINL